MNRQTKRMMQRQGQLAPDGTPARRAPQPRPAPRPVKERTGPGEYARQVRAELRKVAWPTRAEVINYSIIVLVALLVLMALIFGLDYVFGKAVFFLFKT
jgi:preprotein translocase subunit SecE